jgi:hypothetical protein
MRNDIFSIVLAASLYLIPTNTFAWGAKGHALMAEIAFHFLDDSTKIKVKKYLGNLSIEEAANWMDNNRSNSYFDYMKTWHYLDMDKGEHYTPSAERNILTILFSAINDLKKINTLKKKDIKRDILLIFHLVGDLHQPLHTGYAIDKGGNTINVKSQNFSSNLHSAWDSQIIETEGITLDKCLQLYDSTYTIAKKDSVQKINVLDWMYQSRSLLDTVYDYKNGVLDQAYIQRSVVIIENQLIKAGLRLASILKEIFDTPKPAISFMYPELKKADNAIPYCDLAFLYS